MEGFIRFGGGGAVVSLICYLSSLGVAAPLGGEKIVSYVIAPLAGAGGYFAGVAIEKRAKNWSLLILISIFIFGSIATVTAIVLYFKMYYGISSPDIWQISLEFLLYGFIFFPLSFFLGGAHSAYKK